MKALLVAALAACGTDSTALDVVAPGEPVYFKGQIAGGRWKTFTGSFDGVNTTYALSIDGDFTLVMVCEYPDGTFNAAELFGTADDATVSIGSWSVPSCFVTENVAPTTEVTGTMDQAGSVAMLDATKAVNDPTQPYTLGVPNGTHDLVFRNYNFSVGIVHDVAVNGPTDAGMFTFAKASTMLTNDYEVSLTDQEVSQAQTSLVTRNGTSLLFKYSPKMAVFVPPDQLAYGDKQTFALGAESQDGYRIATATDFDTVPPQFDLLASLQAFRWHSGDRFITWTPITDYYTSVSAQFVDAHGSTQTATASKLWLDRHATRAITFDDNTPPGYRWRTLVDAMPFAIAESWSPGLILTSQTHSWTPL